LARRGARVIILCRNLEKAAVAVQDIKDESSNQLVEVEELDLSSLMSVRQCADTLNKKHKQLDFLINNAGKDFVKSNCQRTLIYLKYLKCSRTARYL
jgi:NAD(P)-dependent dehydrogenase (short-subunit alcohol dehydrogenase family)